VKFQDYKFLVLSDLYRVSGNIKLSTFIINVLWGESYKFIFWMRTCRYIKDHIILKVSVYPIALILFQHYKYKFGIGIPFITDIGSGFYIGHFGSIFVYPDTQIGKNCNLSTGVTLGVSRRGKNKGCPIIGDDVFIGPGAKIIGAVKVGNNVAIGANSVVTRDIPDNAVVVGIPAKIISCQGSSGYIQNIDYADKIR
jgi:serine O-acetyltransferase